MSAPKSERIIAALRDDALTKAQIARQLGVTPSYVSLLNRQHGIRAGTGKDFWDRHPERVRAQALADEIARYWTERGAPRPELSVERVSVARSNGGLFIAAEIVSDMADGWPRGWRETRMRSIPGAGRFGADGIRRPGR
jgi:hypothetical protein